MESDKQKTCFVIMPFGERTDKDENIIPFDDVYQFIIREVVEERLGLKCIRCDEITTAGWIHKDMIEHIILDDVVIVDITTLNPNVFYEFGIRHALKPSVTVLIRKKDTNIPFNIKGLRMIDYDLNIKSATKAKNDIERFIRSGLEQQKSDSIVYDIFPSLKVSFK